MATYSINYDLVAPGRDYTNLHNAIKALCTTWAKPLESCWLVTTGKSAAQIRDALIPYMDGNDQLLVLKTGDDWAARNIASSVIEWLRQYIG